ncbi:MAG: endonuclease/exonuclease/phosphatase family protein [Candidatus Nanoarchaeia archaeon]|nr:endonuclease/exonuclease/phosphatase family protein [Candidatus Nanoarchaeia archaeon]
MKKNKTGLGNKAALFAAAGFAGLAGMVGPTLINAALSDMNAEVVTIEENLNNSYEETTEIKIITYNIAHCRGSYDFYGKSSMNDLETNMTIESPAAVYRCLDDVAEMLIKEDADIVLIQETDKDATWSFGIDFMPYLARKAGFNYYAYGAKYDFLWGGYPYGGERGWDILQFNMGNAIMSRYPIISAENKAFDKRSLLDWIAGEERYLDAVIDIHGKLTRVISTHFNFGEIETRKMIQEAENSSMPLIFGGTLHLLIPTEEDVPEELKWCKANAMKLLYDSKLFSIYMLTVNPNDTSYYTSDTENLYWTADYIIPTNDIWIRDYQVIHAELSDHLPVSATLIISL